MMTPRAAIYARISKDKVGAGLGADRQQDDCRELAGRLGWTVAEVFTDNDISAYSGKPRPAYRGMLEAIRAGRVDAVIAWHNDRLHRSPRGLEAFIDLVECSGVRVTVVSGGDYDLTTPEGRFTARIVGAAARKESEDRSRRVRRKHLELAEQGRPASHFGWGVRNEAERELVREAAGRVPPARASSPSLGTGTVAASRGRRRPPGRHRRYGRSSSRRGSPTYGSTARSRVYPSNHGAVSPSPAKRVPGSTRALPGAARHAPAPVSTR